MADKEYMEWTGDICGETGFHTMSIIDTLPIF